MNYKKDTTIQAIQVHVHAINVFINQSNMGHKKVIHNTLWSACCLFLIPSLFIKINQVVQGILLPILILPTHKMKENTQILLDLQDLGDHLS